MIRFYRIVHLQRDLFIAYFYQRAGNAQIVQIKKENGSKKELYTLQYQLKMRLATTQNSASAANATADALAQTSKVQPITIRAAISVISAAPILAIYPFLQKYFVTGMALGSVKG